MGTAALGDLILPTIGCLYSKLPACTTVEGEL